MDAVDTPETLMSADELWVSYYRERKARGWFVIRLMAAGVPETQLRARVARAKEIVGTLLPPLTPDSPGGALFQPEWELGAAARELRRATGDHVRAAAIHAAFFAHLGTGRRRQRPRDRVLI